MSEWPEAVQRVATFLRDAAAEARLEEFSTTTPTAKEAAAAVGCELADIVKSLLFDCDGRPVLVLVPGDRRADTAKVARAAGARAARVAGAQQVASETGFAPGAVAPFALRRVERVLIERTLLGRSLLWVGAGSERHLAGLAPTELVRLARATPADAIQTGA